MDRDDVFCAAQLASHRVVTRQRPTGIHRRLLVRYGKFDTVLPQGQVPVVNDEMSYRCIRARGRCCCPPENKDPFGSFCFAVTKESFSTATVYAQASIRARVLMTRTTHRRVGRPNATAHAPDFAERHSVNTVDVSHDRLIGNAILDSWP